jgi:hypothetical protein
MENLKELSANNFAKAIEKALEIRPEWADGIGYSKSGGYFYPVREEEIPPDAIDQYFFGDAHE